MNEIPDMVPASDLCQMAASILRRIRKSGQPVVITQRGRATAVMVGVDEYRRSERERAMLRSLVKGEKEIAAGRGHNLDDVLAETDRLFKK